VKRVVITGAASGIGAETVAQLRAKGCRVVGLDLEGDGADVLACDVRSQAAVDAAVAEAVARLGGLDVLVNCAGLGLPQSAALAPATTPPRCSTSTSSGRGG
jgi:NAD(P)-dependent dehydrogenase (short-subunit alcohol dehydrogenase family)